LIRSRAATSLVVRNAGMDTVMHEVAAHAYGSAGPRLEAPSSELSRCNAASCRPILGHADQLIEIPYFLGRQPGMLRQTLTRRDAP
jgi:hypothetical protein